jgi:hypothetical protein
MVLVNASLGYTVCLECHQVCEGECPPEWLAEHARHGEDDGARERGRLLRALRRQHA